METCAYLVRLFETCTNNQETCAEIASGHRVCYNNQETCAGTTIPTKDLYNLKSFELFYFPLY